MEERVGNAFNGVSVDPQRWPVIQRQLEPLAAGEVEDVLAAIATLAGVLLEMAKPADATPAPGPPPAPVAWWVDE